MKIKKSVSKILSLGLYWKYLNRGYEYPLAKWNNPVKSGNLDTQMIIEDSS